MASATPSCGIGARRRARRAAPATGARRPPTNRARFCTWRGERGEDLLDRLLVADVRQMPSKTGSAVPGAAGISMPNWLIAASRPTVFRLTVLPPVLGPVTISTRSLAARGDGDGHHAGRRAGDGAPARGGTRSAARARGPQACAPAQRARASRLSSRRDGAAHGARARRARGRLGRERAEDPVRPPAGRAASSCTTALFISTMASGSMNTVDPLADSSCTMPGHPSPVLGLERQHQPCRRAARAGSSATRSCRFRRPCSARAAFSVSSRCRRIRSRMAARPGRSFSRSCPSWSTVRKIDRESALRSGMHRAMSRARCLGRRSVGARAPAALSARTGAASATRGSTVRPRRAPRRRATRPASRATRARRPRAGKSKDGSRAEVSMARRSAAAIARRSATRSRRSRRAARPRATLPAGSRRDRRPRRGCGRTRAAASVRSSMGVPP